MNIHSHKYSGLANSKAITVTATPSGSIQISTRKADASPHSVKGARSTKSIKARSGGRKALGTAAQYAKSGYRPDLRAVRSSLVALVYLFSLSAGYIRPFSERNLVRTHWILLEGWAWTCLQY